MSRLVRVKLLNNLFHTENLDKNLAKREIF